VRAQAGAVRIPVAREGWPLVAPLGLGAALLWSLGWRRTATMAGVGAAACLAFFRDPERTAPRLPGAVLAAADGRVIEVRDVEDPFVGSGTRVAVFLSPLDVHVNRVPVSGLVQDIERVTGRFVPAYRADAGAVNERTTVRIESDRDRVAVSQIAGVVARRVVCRLRPGDWVEAGERFGLIRFGSRTDMVVPRTAAVHARVGDRVVGGVSIVAMMT
jgi:phosphatidylserine decarboxylase